MADILWNDKKDSQRNGLMHKKQKKQCIQEDNNTQQHKNRCTHRNPITTQSHYNMQTHTKNQ